MIWIIADFGPFLLGALLAIAGSRWIRRLSWWLFVPAAIGVAGFAWVALTAGYAGWPREVLLGLFGAAALALPIAFAVAQTPDPRRPRPNDKAWIGLVLLPVFVGVLFPWTVRLSWAQKMAWSCDGVVIEKYRSTNHLAPTLVVRNADATRVKLEGVSEKVWSRAATGDRLVKEPGRSDGRLNGETQELVLRSGS